MAKVLLGDGITEVFRFNKLEKVIVINDDVTRIEDRETLGAKISGVFEDFVLLDYVEGGQGWWPMDSVNLIKP